MKSFDFQLSLGRMSFCSCQDYQYVDGNLCKLSEILIFLISTIFCIFTESSINFLSRTLLILQGKKSNRIHRWRSLSRWSYTLGWWARHWRRTSISTSIIYYLRILNSVRIDGGPLYISICTFFFQESEYYCKFIVVRSFSVSGKLISSMSI